MVQPGIGRSQFADDWALWKRGRNITSTVRVQEAINEAEQWASSSSFLFLLPSLASSTRLLFLLMPNRAVRPHLLFQGRLKEGKPRTRPILTRIVWILQNKSVYLQYFCPLRTALKFYSVNRRHHGMARHKPSGMRNLTGG
ncbi:hypothetical protein SKAU_G00003030 [Synaphobranchus kaupii]|uniref:Uncharacterized protein n=1 Tax=Synaphobranchus kaupii TaxID=118154 RepID=A0A9Q1G9J4_SYNKA|nr:hypothetical protein SKAU_G00003030 [Synaphobranchus kaupii]